jgi:MFS family permease
MIGYAAGWLLVGTAPSYGALVGGMVAVSIAGSISHLPSMAALSHCFSRRRGTALAVHGVGGTLGDVLGPMITGVILTWMTWRGVISIYAAAPLFLAALLYWAFRGLRPGNEETDEAGLGGQLRDTRTLLKSPTVWLLNLVSAMRGMCFQAYTTFLPLFLAEEIGFGSKGVGLHLGLLFTVGMVASPAMGYLSDRVGRKAVVVPTLAGLSAMSVVLALYGDGVMLTVIIAILGFFIRSDYPLISAMVLDAVGDNVATTTLGVMSFTRFSLSAVSPLIAGYLYQRGGMDAVLFYAAGIYAAAGVVLLLAPLKDIGSASDPG